MKAQVVTQIIDPWYVDLNTNDKVSGVVNGRMRCRIGTRITFTSPFSMRS